MRLPGSIPSALALGLFASFLAVALPAALERSEKLVEQAIEHSGETVIEERSRVWGALYTQRIEEIRRLIPLEEPYVLVNGDAVDHGAAIWVRFDLAPRRAILLRRGALHRPRLARKRIPGTARWVIVASRDRLPELIETSRFLSRLEMERRR